MDDGLAQTAVLFAADPTRDVGLLFICVYFAKCPAQIRPFQTRGQRLVISALSLRNARGMSCGRSGNLRNSPYIAKYQPTCKVPPPFLLVMRADIYHSTIYCRMYNVSFSQASLMNIVISIIGLILTFIIAALQVTLKSKNSKTLRSANIILMILLFANLLVGAVNHILDYQKKNKVSIYSDAWDRVKHRPLDAIRITMRMNYCSSQHFITRFLTNCAFKVTTLAGNSYSYRISHDPSVKSFSDSISAVRMSDNTVVDYCLLPFTIFNTATDLVYFTSSYLDWSNTNIPVCTLELTLPFSKMNADIHEYGDLQMCDSISFFARQYITNMVFYLCSQYSYSVPDAPTIGIEMQLKSSLVDIDLNSIMGNSHSVKVISDSTGETTYNEFYISGSDLFDLAKKCAIEACISNKEQQINKLPRNEYHADIAGFIMCYPRMPTTEEINKELQYQKDLGWIIDYPSNNIGSFSINRNDAKYLLKEDDNILPH